MNPSDLADLLYYEGFDVDYGSGHINTELQGVSNDVLIILAALGKLEVRRDLEGNPEYFIPHLHIGNMQQYCQSFPEDPQCKCYDV